MYIRLASGRPEEMSFRIRLMLGFGALVAVTLATGILAMMTLTATSRRAAAVGSEIVEDVADVQRLRLHAEQVVAAARGYLLAPDDSLHAELTRHEADLAHALDELHGDAEPTISAQLAVVEHRLLDYTTATARAARTGSYRAADTAASDALERDLIPRRRALEEAVTKLVEMERTKFANEAALAGDVVRRFGLTIMAGWAVAFAICVTLAIVVMRRLSVQYRSVVEAQHAATRVAAARKELLDIVAHDLLTPLNAIALGLEVMKERDIDVPLSATLANATQRMNRLVNDLVDVSRAEQQTLQIERRDTLIEPLLKTAVDLFAARAARANVELHIECSSSLRGAVDSERVIQVLTNLVGNAIAYTPPDGRVRISATEQPDGCLHFAVTDSGPGLGDIDVASLFEPYRQGESHDGKPRGKLGLGLYISKSLVEAHGGRIGATSSSEGATFWFELPREA